MPYHRFRNFRISGLDNGHSEYAEYNYEYGSRPAPEHRILPYGHLCNYRRDRTYIYGIRSGGSSRKDTPASDEALLYLKEFMKTIKL